MSSALMFSDLSLENKDQIQRLGRRTYLQFVTLNYVILKEIEEINNILGRQKSTANTSPAKGQKSTAYTSPGSVLATNPYRLKSDVVAEIINVGEGNPQMIKAYSNYMIALTLQRLFSYGLIDTRRIFDLKSVLIEGIELYSDSDATKDTLDETVRDYYTEILRKRLREAMEKANNGSPVTANVDDIIVQALLSMGDLTDQDTDILLEGESLDENSQARKEIDLVSDLFEQSSNASTGQPHRVPCFKKGNTEAIVSCYLELAGLQTLFNIFNAYLLDELPEGAIEGLVNSPLFNTVPSAWSALFGDAQPEIIDILVGLLPTIEDRFRTSTPIANSETQGDIQYEGLQVMLEFLKRTLTPIRIKELQDLLEDPNGNAALVTFRSLAILGTMSDWQRPKASTADPTKIDKTDRLGYLKLIHWCLTDEKELNIIFDYAYRYYIEDGFPNKKHIKELQPPIAVIPAAMFPGSLELYDMLPGGGMLLDMNYRRDQKSKEILETRLAKAGGIESALNQAHVRWYP